MYPPVGVQSDESDDKVIMYIQYYCRNNTRHIHSSPCVPAVVTLIFMLVLTLLCLWSIGSHHVWLFDLPEIPMNVQI